MKEVDAQRILREDLRKRKQMIRERCTNMGEVYHSCYANKEPLHVPAPEPSATEILDLMTVLREKVEAMDITDKNEMFKIRRRFLLRTLKDFSVFFQIRG